MDYYYIIIVQCNVSVYSKLCENTNNYKSAYPGSNKVVYWACEQESEEKNLIVDF